MVYGMCKQVLLKAKYDKCQCVHIHFIANCSIRLPLWPKVMGKHWYLLHTIVNGWTVTVTVNVTVTVTTDCDSLWDWAHSVCQKLATPYGGKIIKQILFMCCARENWNSATRAESADRGALPEVFAMACHIDTLTHTQIERRRERERARQADRQTTYTYIDTLASPSRADESKLWKCICLRCEWVYSLPLSRSSTHTILRSPTASVCHLPALLLLSPAALSHTAALPRSFALFSYCCTLRCCCACAIISKSTSSRAVLVAAGWGRRRDDVVEAEVLRVWVWVEALKEFPLSLCLSLSRCALRRWHSRIMARQPWKLATNSYRAAQRSAYL